MIIATEKDYWQKCCSDQCGFYVDHRTCRKKFAKMETFCIVPGKECPAYDLPIGKHEIDMKTGETK